MPPMLPKNRLGWLSLWVLALGMVSGRVTTATAAPAAAAPARPMVLPWIEDDWTRAVAQAKQRKLPIFVESWAPW